MKVSEVLVGRVFKAGENLGVRVYHPDALPSRDEPLREYTVEVDESDRPTWAVKLHGRTIVEYSEGAGGLLSLAVDDDVRLACEAAYVLATVQQVSDALGGFSPQDIIAMLTDGTVGS